MYQLGGLGADGAEGGFGIENQRQDHAFSQARGVQHMLGVGGGQAHKAHQVVFLVVVPVSGKGGSQFVGCFLGQLPGISPQLVGAGDQCRLCRRFKCQPGEMLGSPIYIRKPGQVAA